MIMKVYSIACGRHGHGGIRSKPTLQGISYLFAVVCLSAGCVGRPLFQGSVYATEDSFECALEYVQAHEWILLDVRRTEAAEAILATRTRQHSPISDRLVVSIRRSGDNREMKVTLTVKDFYEGLPSDNGGESIINVRNVSGRRHRLDMASHRSIEDARAVVTLCTSGRSVATSK